MTDHKAEAIDLLEMAAHARTTEQETAEATKALAHATLALVEQQRIANLIAMLPRLDDTTRTDAWDMDRRLPTERDGAVEAIRKGLGL